MSKYITTLTPRLDVNELVRAGYIRIGKNTVRKFKINNCLDPFTIIVNGKLKNPSSMTLKLIYQVNSNTPEINLDISLVLLKTNLGNGGTYLNFICPYSEKVVKTLYQCKQTLLFVARSSLFNLTDSRYFKEEMVPIINNDMLRDYKKKQRQEMKLRNEKANRILDKI